MSTIEKFWAPSRVRPGREQTTPTWKATHGELVLFFARKRDAEKFAANGCPRVHSQDWLPCVRCRGRVRI